MNIVKTFKLVLTPTMFKLATEAAAVRGMTLTEYVNEHVSPVPCEVFVQKPIPAPKPNIRSIPMWVDVPSVGDR